jgi:hypothetical protein
VTVWPASNGLSASRPFAPLRHPYSLGANRHAQKIFYHTWYNIAKIFRMAFENIVRERMLTGTNGAESAEHDYG